MFMYFAIAVVLVAAIAVATWFLKRQRADLWQEWARAKGLTYLAPPAGPKIIGRIGDRQVSIAPHERGSDAEGPVEIVQCCVTLNGVGISLDAEGAPGLIGDLAQLGADRIQTGDAEFDRDVIVRGDSDETALLEYWTAPRRSAFLKLVNDAPCDRVMLQGEMLIGEERSIISSRQHMDELADALLAAAKVLDGERES